MTKLFLMQSKSKEEDAGDVIVDLNKIFTFRIIKKDKLFSLALDYTETDKVSAVFDNLEDTREVLKSIFSALGQDVLLADAMQPIVYRDKSKEKIAVMLKDLMGS